MKFKNLRVIDVGDSYLIKQALEWMMINSFRVDDD
jgi:hypothetical protein